MKKILVIIFLGLFLNTNTYGQVITFYNCAQEQDNYVFNDKKYERYEIRFDLSNKIQENIIILTDDYSKEIGESKYRIWETKISKIIDHFVIHKAKRSDGSTVIEIVYDLKSKVYEITDYGDNGRVRKTKCK